MKLLMLFILLACGTTQSRYVTPYQDHFEVNYKEKTKQNSLEKVVEIAHSHCNQSGKKLIVSEKSSEYEGDLPESVYLMVQKVGRAGASLLGSKMGHISDKVLKDAGYRSILKGKCE